MIFKQHVCNVIACENMIKYVPHSNCMFAIMAQDLNLTGYIIAPVSTFAISTAAPPTPYSGMSPDFHLTLKYDSQKAPSANFPLPHKSREV